MGRISPGFQWHSKAHLCAPKELLNEEVCFLKEKKNQENSEKMFLKVSLAFTKQTKTKQNKGKPFVVP